MRLLLVVYHRQYDVLLQGFKIRVIHKKAVDANQCLNDILKTKIYNKQLYMLSLSLRNQHAV